MSRVENRRSEGRVTSLLVTCWLVGGLATLHFVAVPILAWWWRQDHASSIRPVNRQAFLWSADQMHNWLASQVNYYASHIVSAWVFAALAVTITVFVWISRRTSPGKAEDDKRIADLG